MTVLSVRSLSVSFAGTAVLDDLSLNIEAGQFVSIIGPSGSGKSTLLHAIGGLLEPDSGDILIGDRVVTGDRGHISYMPQQPALFPWRTIIGNVVLGAEVQRGRSAESQRHAREWLSRIGLERYADEYPHVLSGGQQQRIAFLRALLTPQELIALDEPFSALDALTRSRMQQWLLDIWQENRRSVLLVTHSIDEALLLSDAIYVLSVRPARVLTRIEVPFPRPRDHTVTDTGNFATLRRQIRALLDAAETP